MGKKINNSGMSLVELMVACGILAVFFLGVIIVFIKCIQMTELARNSSLAMSLAKTRMEQIRLHNNIPFNQVLLTYDGIIFPTPGLNGKGVSYVDADITNPKLLTVTVEVSWREKSGLIVGEDKNLDGQFEVGEDTLVVNTRLDSPAEITGIIYDY
ncbi:MAG: prepilin-type N-terminal cleavage/methylation domain-containing protein [Candidatus Omnitrophica bacterium]|nr:prepilin-type N-terminal cleavage/methylation domain-containing protein [Candidatus Omnitrophota bacterium]